MYGESHDQAEGAGVTTAKLVGLFALVGGGLAIGTLLFLWATGFFKESEAASLDALGQQFLGGIAIGAVLVFSVLIGVVIAVMGGVYAGSVSDDRIGAFLTAGVGATIGHAALVLTLGGVLIVGMDALQQSRPAATPEPTPEQRTAEELAECRSLFGADSIVCAVETPSPSLGEDDAASVDTEDIAKLSLGMIPAGIVGGFSGAIMFRRRERYIES